MTGQGLSEAVSPGELEVRHCAVAGRVRFVCRARLYHARQKVPVLEHRLRRHGCIRHARGNPLTGTVLIRFDPEHSLDAVREILEAELDRLVNPAQAPERLEGRPSARDEVSQPAVLRAQGNDWCQQSPEAVCRGLATHPQHGLTDGAAAQRLAEHGLNELPRAEARSDLELFLEQLKSAPVAMLGGAAVLSVLTGGVADALAIGAVVAINAVIGFVTERRSERIIGNLDRSGPRTARVVREHVRREVPAEVLVPGDLVLLQEGDVVPADLRVLNAEALAVNESLLTGESMMVSKGVAALDEPLPLADRSNMLYRDTLITAGSGAGIVVATGAATEVGQVHELMDSSRPPATPMQQQLDRVGTQLVWLSSAVCTGIFLLGWLRGYGLVGTLNRAVSLAVAALPEGLPTVATTTLAIGVRQMRTQRAQVRSLNAVETLGACQVICLDKTGTLTENRLQAVEVLTADRRFDLEDPSGGRGAEPAEAGHFWLLGRTLALCVENGHNGHASSTQRTLLSPTESALADLVRWLGDDPVEIRRRYRLIDIEHRADGRPYLVTHHQAGGVTLTSVKGSPDHVLALCDAVATNGRIRPLDDAWRQRLQRQNRGMAGKALRVLAVACGGADPGSAPSPSLIWLGLVGLTDPVRRDARDVIARLHRAGIQTVMITGDQGPTAHAIAQSLDLSGGAPLRVVDARDLAKGIDDVDRIHAFARVAPGQKSAIVRAFQRAGRVVAMTGDGVNDGPALKAADIGIALGKNGTETARLAADVVLEDDNLATLVFSVEQGRTIYGNIRKSIRYLLSTNLSEIEVMLAAVVFNLGQPLSAMQLLWINLLTDVFPGLALAMEPPEPHTLDQPPRDRAEAIIGGKDFRRLAFQSSTISAGAMASYLYGLSRYGTGPRAGSHAFLTLVLGQLLHTWSCRSDQRLFGGAKSHNRYVDAAVGGSLALQGLAVAVGPLRRLLGLSPLGIVDLAAVLAGALAPLIINEATKERASP